MSKPLPKVLVISSADPTKGSGGVALNFYNALKAAGAEVDFLAKDYVAGHPEFLNVLNTKRKWPNYLAYKFYKKVNRRSTAMGVRLEQQGNHSLDYTREEVPPVPSRLVLRKIRKQYDVVYVVFWYQMLSYKTISDIYDKLHCQIHLRCPDNQPVSGGCHFIGDCQRFRQGCGHCPALINESDDFTDRNVAYRKAVIDRVRPLIYGNTHMQQIYKQSPILNDYDRLVTAFPLVDNEFFHPIDKAVARREMGVSEEKKLIFFFGSTLLTEKRKGMGLLVEALQTVYNHFSETKRRETLLLVAGFDIDQIAPQLPFDYLPLGYLPFDRLPMVYSAVTAYLSPSIDDAGPSMVNQSLSCGTPVVAFNIGTALDMIESENTGYCAKKPDSTDFAAGIEKISNLSEEEYRQMSACCRAVALKKTSAEAFVEQFVSTWQRFSEPK